MIIFTNNIKIFYDIFTNNIEIFLNNIRIILKYYT